MRRDLEKREYHLVQAAASPAADGATVWWAHNMAHGLNVSFTGQGVRLARSQGSSVSEWGMELTAYGYPKNMQPVGAATLHVEGNRIEYRRGPLTEWYVNDELGLEQGFTLDTPPARDEGSDEAVLSLELSLNGNVSPVLSSDERSIRIKVSGNPGSVRYGALYAQDSEGSPLATRLALQGRTLAILIDAENAAYPITIDPLLTSEDWTSPMGTSDYEYLGYAVAGAGDLNGDGFDDIAIGAPTYSTFNTGRFYVFHGGPGGPADTPDLIVNGTLSYGRLGTSLAGAGDVNGDGYDDLVVGALGCCTTTDIVGRAYVYFGGSTGLSTSNYWYVESDQPGAYFGNSVAGAGDVNGDGYADIIVGASNHDNGGDGTKEGAAFVYLGGETGLGSSGTAAAPFWIFEGDQEGSAFGGSVAGAGDVNGDGYDDLIVGARNYFINNESEGRAYVYHGGSAATAPLAAWTFDGSGYQSYLGRSVAGAGDLNGDGYGDVIVGAPAHYAIGEAYAFYGGASGLSASPDWIGTDHENTFQYGISVAGLGDLNRDGYDDVVVGSVDTFNPYIGSIYVYYGRPTGLSSLPAWGATGRDLETQYQPRFFGFAVGGAGDVDGDGYDDVIVGAYGYGASLSGPQSRGQAYVFYGRDFFYLDSDWGVEGSQIDERLGAAVASAGDVNNDGYDDVLVGAPGYDNEKGAVFVYHGSTTGLSSTPNATLQPASGSVGGNFSNFGASLAGAGDVNGDGYDDVVVGQWGWDEPVTGAPHSYDEGRAYVFYGSAGGLSTSWGWSRTSGQAGASFGSSVASAGDVNDDGYDDVLIAAPVYDNLNSRAGKAYLFLGSASGLSALEDWSVEGDSTNKHVGNLVAGAGDVNGDGYDDALINNNLTGAELYLGSPSGLGSTPYWSSSVAGRATGAGDVNGDGHPDVIVGDPFFRDPDRSDYQFGAAYGFYWDGSWLPGNPDWTLLGHQIFSSLGGNVAGAGDVNADGYADVLVSARGQDGLFENEGTVYLYMGTASGLEENFRWGVDGRSANEYLNRAAAAGDVNGDGCADIIVGSSGFDSSSFSNAGAAYLYYGARRLGSAGSCENTSPVGVDDNYAAHEDTILSVTSPGVLNNDSDPDGDVIRVESSTDPAYGSLEQDEAGSFTYTPDPNFCGADSYEYTVSDGSGETDTAIVSIDVICVNDPPQLSADQQNVAVSEGQTASNTGTVDDIEGDAVELTASVGSLVSNNGSWSWSYPTSDGPTNSQTVTITATDGAAETSITFELTVHNVPPSVGPPLLSEAPSDEGEAVVASASFSDPAGSSDQLYGCAVDYGDGSGWIPGTISASTCTGALHEYRDNGTFDVSIQVTDKDGGTGVSSTTPQTVNNVPPTVGPIMAPSEPIPVGTSLDVSTPFTDPGTLDTHVALWHMGDGSTLPGTVNEADGSGSVADSHTYTTAGVFAISVDVTDDDGGVGTALHEYVVVYDSEGAFVTGAGWVQSPEGSYTPDPTLAGRAIFGFVSKYKKGATAPSGQTEFRFKAADMDFHSTSYEWLVVAGPQAKFKGVGQINGQGNYGFMLSAVDGAESGGGGDDKLRIKIWDKDDGDTVVYDNQLGDDDQAPLTTVIEGGSIVIHK